MTATEKINKILLHLEINAKAFSEQLGYPRPQIIYDIQKGKTKRISEELANKITSVFPDISKSWLLADEGEMIKIENAQNTIGDNNTQVAGNSNNVNNSTTIERAIDEISEMRKLIQEQVRNNQEQFDRFMSVIERLTMKIE